MCEAGRFEFSDCARVDGHAGSTGARGLCDVRCAPTSGTKADMPGGQDWAQKRTHVAVDRIYI
jgi:hypothetical protein